MERRRISVLLGSPRRNGNSEELAREVAKGAMEAGAHVQTFYLAGMDIAGCTGCDSCQQDPGSGCVTRDGMQVLYSSLTRSDAIVFATPVYWFSVTAQMKAAIDRLYAVGGGDANVLGGKTLGLVLTYADEDPFFSGAAGVVRMFQEISAYLGTSIAGVVHGSAHVPGEIRSNAAAMSAARDLGKRLAEAP